MNKVTKWIEKIKEKRSIKKQIVRQKHAVSLLHKHGISEKEFKKMDYLERARVAYYIAREYNEK